MAGKTKKQRIQEQALEIIKANEEGIRYSDLVKAIHLSLPDIPINTIHGSMWNLNTLMPDKVYKPVKGLFRWIEYQEEDTGEGKTTEELKIKEEAFYKPFADWLEKELEECSRAIPLGGNNFKDKWGTPDVLGIMKSKQSDIFKVPTEIIAAEIKLDSGNLITAFGQACAYKLFSHKSFLVVPRQSSKEDLARIEALCLIFGIGLVLFNESNPEEPAFEIRTRAIKNEPDRFFVNKYMVKEVVDELFR